LPVPIWITAPAGYMALFWEVCFIPLVLFKRTRPWALAYGVAFHALIFLSLEVGWFSVYSLALYPIWIADRFWATAWPVWRGRCAEVVRHLRHRLRYTAPL
jgi:hypothetical protein